MRLPNFHFQPAAPDTLKPGDLVVSVTHGTAGFYRVLRLWDAEVKQGWGQNALKKKVSYAEVLPIASNTLLLRRKTDVGVVPIQVEQAQLMRVGPEVLAEYANAMMGEIKKGIRSLGDAMTSVEEDPRIQIHDYILNAPTRHLDYDSKRKVPTIKDAYGPVYGEGLFKRIGKGSERSYRHLFIPNSQLAAGAQPKELTPECSFDELCMD